MSGSALAKNYEAMLAKQSDTVVPTEAEEMWTFVRRQGGDWLLSAIQQV